MAATAVDSNEIVLMSTSGPPAPDGMAPVLVPSCFNCSCSPAGHFDCPAQLYDPPNVAAVWAAAHRPDPPSLPAVASVAGLRARGGDPSDDDSESIPSKPKRIGIDPDDDRKPAAKPRARVPVSELRWGDCDSDSDDEFEDDFDDDLDNVDPVEEAQKRERAWLLGLGLLHIDPDSDGSENGGEDSEPEQEDESVESEESLFTSLFVKKPGQDPAMWKRDLYPERSRDYVFFDVDHAESIAAESENSSCSTVSTKSVLGETYPPLVNVIKETIVWGPYADPEEPPIKGKPRYRKPFVRDIGANQHVVVRTCIHPDDEESFDGELHGTMENYNPEFAPHPLVYELSDSAQIYRLARGYGLLAEVHTRARTRRRAPLYRTHELIKTYVREVMATEVARRQVLSMIEGNHPVIELHHFYDEEETWPLRLYNDSDWGTLMPLDVTGPKNFN